MLVCVVAGSIPRCRARERGQSKNDGNSFFVSELFVRSAPGRIDMSPHSLTHVCLLYRCSACCVSVRVRAMFSLCSPCLKHISRHALHVRLLILVRSHCSSRLTHALCRGRQPPGKMSDLGDAFEVAAMVLDGPPPAEGGDGDGLGEAFEAAAGILVAGERPHARVLGLPARSPATAAFARQCRATQIAQSKAEEMKQRFDELRARFDYTQCSALASGTVMPPTGSGVGRTHCRVCSDSGRATLPA